MIQQPKRRSGVTPGKQERHLNISQKLEQAVHQACLDAPEGLATPEHLIAAINHPANRELPKPHAKPSPELLLLLRAAAERAVAQGRQTAEVEDVNALADPEGG